MVTPLPSDQPRTIGPYHLVGQLGDGGLGPVFMGRSPGGVTAAVKVIRAELAADPWFRTQFRAEVEAARKVSGAFVTPVVDADLDGDVPWLATAYVEGQSLAETVREHGPLPGGPLVALAAGLAEGLGVVHAAGVVHGNLHPRNVLLAADGPRVTDFGIWQAATASGLPDAGFGSPEFLSPEQVLGQDTGPASDIFSLGAVLVFAGSGHGPFGSGTSAALMYRLVNSPADVSDLPVALRELVGSCLARQPENRPSAIGLLAGFGGIRSRTGRQTRSDGLAGPVRAGGFAPTARVSEPVAAVGVSAAAIGVSEPVVAVGVSAAAIGVSAAVGMSEPVAAVGVSEPAVAGVSAAAVGTAAVGTSEVAGTAGAGLPPGSGPGELGRSQRHRRFRPSAPAWIAGGLFAASAGAIVFLTGAVPSSPAGQDHVAVLAGPTSSAQGPIISGSSAGNSNSPPSGSVSSPSGNSDPSSGGSGGLTPAALLGPSASALPSPSTSSSVPPSSLAPPPASGSASPSASRSASPSPSKSGSPSPSASPSKSPSPSPSPSSASPSPSPSPSSTSPSPSSSPSSSSSSSAPAAPSPSSASPSSSAPAAPSPSSASPSSATSSSPSAASASPSSAPSSPAVSSSASTGSG